LAAKAIKLNYLSAERFFKDYERLLTGKIFLPTPTPLPLKTRISLNITIPDIEEVLTVEGGVVKTIDDQKAAQLKKPTGMLVGLIGGAEAALKNLNRALSANTYYRMLLNLPSEFAEDESSRPVSDPVNNPEERSVAENTSPAVTAEQSQPDESTTDNVLTMDWIREAIAQEEAAREKESTAQIAAAPVTEKKQLSPADRAKVKPSGEFLMDLTKAMLRSGYYASDHSGAENAKHGL